MTGATCPECGTAINDSTRKWLSGLMQAEDLSDWNVEISPAGNMCWFNRKVIAVGTKHANKRGMYLHECAHAILGKRSARDYHDVIFADKLTELIDKYLPVCKGKGIM